MCSKLQFIVLALVVAVAAANVLPPLQTRIIGGAGARAGQFPYAASIQTPQHGHVCGAAIINQRWVLTAASCTFAYWIGDNVFSVRTGTNNYNSGGVVHQPSNLINHAEFDYNTRRNDIALVQTKTNIANNANSRPIALPRSDFNAGSAYIVGWGHTDINNPRKSVALQYTSTQIIGNEQCRKELTANNFQNFVRSTNICTNAGYGVGVCRADSGSPLALNNELVGIVSFGVSCATGVPDVYTRVYSYQSWINKHAV